MLPLLYVVFVLSGAAGLIYEVIWTRYLGLFVGHSAYAQIIVLVMFLGGMSLGALVVGRWTERLRQPLVWYAGVEAATGLIGLVFHDVFVATTHLAYVSLFPAVGLGVSQTLIKWGLASLLILPQSILLGMTFPLMSAGVVRRIPTQPGRALSMLYFANSLGAAAGVLVAGFRLVAIAGLPGTLVSAAILNLVVAVIVFVAVGATRGSSSVDLSTVAPALGRSGDTPKGLVRLLLAVSFGTALSSFIYEIGWTRMLALVLGSATHSFELMLSAFILGLAWGAYTIRRRADAAVDTIRILGYVQLAMGTLAVCTLPVYLASYKWMVGLLAALAKTPEGYTLFNLSRYGMCLAVMVPATFCAGMTLPLITRTLVGAGVGERAIGDVYGVNTLGSIVGAALAGLVLLPVLGLKWLLIAGALVDIALGIVLLASRLQRTTSDRRSTMVRGVAIAVAATIVVAIGLRADFDSSLLTSGVYRYGATPKPHSREVVFYKDGRTASVSVSRVSTGGLSLATNGKPDASLGPEWLGRGPVTPGPFTHDAMTQTLVPLVAMGFAPHARTAAIIGFGSGMTSHTLLGSPEIRDVYTIEIEREMIEGSRHFQPANRRAYDDPRSHLIIDDARSYFAASGRTFDLIISEPSNPWVSGVSSLFTTEFYAQVKRSLAPNAIFAQWLQLYEIDDGLMLGVIGALSHEFPAFSIYQLSGRDILVVATTGRELPTADWSIVKFPLIAADLERVWPLTPRTFETLHVADRRSLEPLLHLGGVENSDFYPTLDLNAERTRFMKTQANGLSGLAAARVDIPAIVDGRRNGLGDPYAVVADIPRLRAMAVAAAMRNGDARGGPDATAARARAGFLANEISTGRPPADWHVWVQGVATVEADLHGGMAGVVDSAFYATLREYVGRTNAPPIARAAIDFMHGLAAWDFAESSRAADVLVAAADRGDLWLDPDELRDGAVISKVAIGNRAAARQIFRALFRLSNRDVTDLRTRLLYSYVSDTTEARQ